MAQATYKPGDIIQGPCEPLIRFTKIEAFGRVCNFCLKESTSLKCCTGCRKMYYCNKTCQQADWNISHKLECKSTFFRNNIFNGINCEFRFQIFRMFAAFQQNSALGDKKFAMYDGTERCFNDLVSHVDQEQQQSSLILKMELGIIVDGLKQEKFDLNGQRILELFSICKTNAFQILNASESKQLGSGIYVEQSIFDHSCKPNAFYCTYGGTPMFVRASTLINKGEKIYISYLAKNDPKIQRQLILMERYRFECHCERCETESDKDVDFDKLNGLIQEMEMNKSFGNLRFEQVLENHEEIIKNMRKLYYEYDYRIANQYARYFYGLAMTRQLICMPKQEYDKIMNEIRDHLYISFGAGHYEYEQFKGGCLIINSKRTNAASAAVGH